MRGLKWSYWLFSAVLIHGRIPHGMRGLKSKAMNYDSEIASSHPARDAWIEMNYSLFGLPYTKSRIPHGMRGLKLRQE